MAGFQFIHVEGYGRSAGKGKAGGRSIGSVVAEAERQEGNAPHVKNPEPPTVVHGVSPSEAGRIATERADQAKDAQGRAMRKDGLCLLAGVVSFPHTVDECKADPAKMAAYRSWEKDSLRFLQRTYGEDLSSVVRHTDEAFPHLHFYVTPKPNAAGRLSLDSVHDGRRAASAAKAAGEVKGEQNRAYKEAMRGFQNRYFEAVGIKHGQARMGPGRRRLTREGWKAEQAAVETMAESLKTARAQVVQETKAEASTYVERVRQEALTAAQKEAERVRAMARQAAEQEAKRIVNRAKKKAKKEVERIVSKAKGVGGWIQGVVDGMRGKRREMESAAELAVKAVKEEAEFEKRQLELAAKADRERVKELSGQVGDLKHRLSETAAERDRARDLVARYAPKDKVAPAQVRTLKM